MLDGLISIWPFLVVSGVGIVIFSLVSFIITRNYDVKKLKFYSFFMDANRRDAFIASTAVLNFAIVVYFAVWSSKFEVLGALMILASSLVSILVSFNFRIILVDILYAGISVVSLWLIELIKIYVQEVYDDKMVAVLAVISTMALVVFAALMSLRKVEIIVKRNKFVRRNNG